MHISIKFVWEDMWFGLYWDSKKKVAYICLVPCFPIIIRRKR
jgi:hypothetical protein